jgi:hypothetical protein
MASEWIGVVSGLAAAAISGVVALRQRAMDARLQEEVHKREALFDRELAAEEILKRYREPLAAAAYDLQSRLYNILCLDFFREYGPGDPREEDAYLTTLFRFAQYFGWSEILRRDIQVLSFPDDEDTKRVARLQSEISRRLLTHEQGKALMIWSDEQRAIGELMIVEQQGKLMPMGYATFRGRCDDSFALWRDRFRDELRDDPARTRMRDVQHLLCDLVEALDRGRIRYTDELRRAPTEPS